MSQLRPVVGLTPSLYAMLPESITAKDCMSTAVVSLTPNMDVLAAMQLLVTHSISGAPVLDEHGDLVGILTERDCLETLVIAGYHGECACGKVADYMSRDVAVVDADANLVDVARLFVTTKYRRYPVLEQQRVVGIISRRDVVQTFLQFA